MVEARLNVVLCSRRECIYNVPGDPVSVEETKDGLFTPIYPMSYNYRCDRVYPVLDKKGVCTNFRTVDHDRWKPAISYRKWIPSDVPSTEPPPWTLSDVVDAVSSLPDVVGVEDAIRRAYLLGRAHESHDIDVSIEVA